MDDKNLSTLLDMIAERDNKIFRLEQDLTYERNSVNRLTEDRDRCKAQLADANEITRKLKEATSNGKS